MALPAGDNLGVHLALAEAEPGTVLCIASAGQGSFGVFGELLMAAAKHRGILAVVTDDGVRDLSGSRSPTGDRSAGNRRTRNDQAATPPTGRCPGLFGWSAC